MFSHKSPYFFPWLNKLYFACQQLENSPNYQPNETDEKISVHAVVIQPSGIKAKNAAGDSLGATYLIKTRRIDNWYEGGGEFPPLCSTSMRVWVLLLNMSGQPSLHEHTDALAGEFGLPIADLGINKFLAKQGFSIETQAAARRALAFNFAANNADDPFVLSDSLEEKKHDESTQDSSPRFKRYKRG